jgi:hypothetical protein
MTERWLSVGGFIAASSSLGAELPHCVTPKEYTKWNTESVSVVVLQLAQTLLTATASGRLKGD